MGAEIRALLKSADYVRKALLDAAKEFSTAEAHSDAGDSENGVLDGKAVFKALKAAANNALKESGSVKAATTRKSVTYSAPDRAICMTQSLSRDGKKATFKFDGLSPEETEEALSLLTKRFGLSHSK